MNPDGKALIKKKAAIRDSASNHLVKKKWSKALEEFRTLQELDPTDMRTRLKIGDILLRMGKREDGS